MNKNTRSTKSEIWRHTCNSVEIACTHEQKVAVTSYGRNKNHDDETKKHSRTSPEIQFKEMIEKLRRTLPGQQINWTMPARTKKSSKNWETKRIKTKQKQTLAKTLEAFKPKAKFFPYKNIYYQKYVQHQFLFLKSVQYYICKTWKIFIGPWRSINSKMTKKFL